MELQKINEEGVLELNRTSAKIGSTVNAVWGTIEGNIQQQLDLQTELTKVKYDDTELKKTIADMQARVEGETLILY